MILLGLFQIAFALFAGYRGKALPADGFERSIAVLAVEELTV
jgi:hypothetical protein